MVTNLGRALSVLISVFLCVVPTDIIAAQDTTMFSGYGFRISMPGVVDPFQKEIFFGVYRDTLRSPIGLMDVSFGEEKTAIAVDPDWTSITFTETLDERIYKIPFTAPLEWYLTKLVRLNSRKKLHEIALKGTSDKSRDSRKGTRSIEVVGMEMGKLGRASLRVRGNVNISGKLVFQDQELVRSSINETQNTHIEFDQRQNLNIEGKVGDRITVLMDQDSERDFDWENNIRISYQGEEDDIIQKVEAGNISLSLPATQYVTFSGQNKGLFGLKGISKIGPIDITSIASIEQTKKEQQRYSGGSEAQTTRIKDYEYVKNQYFFVHEWFRNGILSDTLTADTTGLPYQGNTFVIPSFYPLRNGLHLIGNAKIANFELYKLDLSNNPAADVGVAYIDPSDSLYEEDESKEGNFLRMERDTEYFISEDLGFFRLRSRSMDEIIGCHFVLVNRDNGDTLITVGSGISPGDSVGTLKLKMIKPQSPHPNHPTWDLMFKNVYYLGTTKINREGFEIKLVNERLTPPSHLNPLGYTYLSQFGLDSLSETGTAVPDDIIDMDNPNIVNMVTGELIFPALSPFVADTTTYTSGSDTLDFNGEGNGNVTLYSALGDGKMYTSTINSEYTGDQRFTIEAEYSNPSSSISLGFMLVEGSEEVLLNGIRLTRGIDYQIDYFSGTIVLGEAATDPNANIEILYDKHELVSFDKKVILGSRAQMDLGKNSFIGATALFFDQSVMNEKIEVGYEPTRNFIWDLNGRYELEMDGLTRALDNLPIIETEKMSTFSLEGEIAQVIPNPNPINNSETGDPNGVAYIDDFEGAKRTSSPPIQRRYWKEASAPLDSSGIAFPQNYRLKTNWYNPYGQVRTKDIWPNQSTSVRAQNETTDIMVLKLEKKPFQDVFDPDSLWGGITTSFYSGDYDQTQSKFFEIWLNGTKGDLTVNLGKISEDKNGDGSLNTEDIPEAGLTLGNGFLEDHEDVGLDGCFDELEDGLGGCFGFDNDGDGISDEEIWDYIDNDGDGSIDEDIDSSIPIPGYSETDPNGDNWNYSEGSSNYSQVNGTEGNGTGTQIQEGGKYPDTEDLDRSGFIDKTNDYFSKTISLEPNHPDTSYLAGETEKNGVTTGWRLYRIPLSHFGKVSNIEWNEIRYLRLIWSGIPSDLEKLLVARIELVGNEWQELGVSPMSEDTYTRNDSIFSIAVINTEDNADYIPPKGVKGEYDRINEIRSKEQSLVLKFDSLQVGNKAAAQKNLISLTGDRAKSFLIYDKMKMYVYGKSSDWIQADNSDVDVFLRFGLGDDYYEITQPVFEGWDEQLNRNKIELDLNWLTKLKVQDSENVNKVRDTDTLIVRDNIRTYVFTDELGDSTGKKITIKGQPSLSRIQFFKTGILNDHPGQAISGEVWIDELRLSGVKKDRGVAMRMQSKFYLADLGNTSIVYSRKDADFHVLQQRLGSNKSSEDIRINNSFNLHKLLPKWMGLSIPLSSSFSRLTTRPKFYPGTDIYADQGNTPDSIMTKSQSLSFSSSISKSSKSDNKLIRLTLDNIKGNFSTSRSLKSSEIMEKEENQTYTGKLSYGYSFGRDNYVKPFGWMNSVPLIGKKMSEFQMYYTPSSVNTSIDFSEKLTEKLSRSGLRSPDIYNLGLNRSFGLDYKMFSNLTIKYNQKSKSNMNDFRGYVWKAVKDMDPGIVTNVTENLTTNFNPELLSFLKPNISYSAGYRWDKPLSSTIDGADIGTQIRFSTNLSLSLTQIIESVYKPPSSKKSGSSQGRSRTRSRVQPEGENDDKDNKEGKGNFILNAVHGFFNRIDPLNITYTETVNRTARGVQGAVPVGYRFGWQSDHGLSQDSASIGSNIGNFDHKQDISLRSGFKLTKKTSVSLSFGENVSQTISGSGVEQRSIQRDFLPWGERLEQGLPFFGWSMRMSGLEKWPILNKFVRSASLDHSFSGKESRSWQFEDVNAGAVNLLDMSSFIDTFKDYEKQGKVNASFSPLIGMSLSLGKGVSVQIRQNMSQSLDEMPTGLTLKKDRSLTTSASYNHKGGFKIPIPYFEDMDIQNNVNFTLNFDMNNSETWGTKNKTELAQQALSSSWKIGTRISYSFNRNVSGGIIYEYRENETKTTGKKIDRDFGFDINISISG